MQDWWVRDEVMRGQDEKTKKMLTGEWMDILLDKKQAEGGR